MRWQMEENENQNGGGKKIPAWATRLPFGLCKKYGIPLSDRATPRDAWNALKGRGVSRAEIYASINDKGKTPAKKAQVEPIKQEKPKKADIAETEKPKEKKTSRERFIEWQREKHKRELERFFAGGIKKVSNQYYKFNNYIDDDNVIIVTRNLKMIKDTPVLMISNNKAVYLKEWQLKPVSTWSEDYGTEEGFAVKLNRNYYKPYTFKEKFAGYHFGEEDELNSFDDVVKLAKEQQAHDTKWKLN